MDYSPRDVGGQFGLEVQPDKNCSRGTSNDNTQPKAMQTGALGLGVRAGEYMGSLKVGSPCNFSFHLALPICTPVYKYTQDRSFLDTSLKMARLFIDRLASSSSTIAGVPAWDFDAPPPTSADTSAASVAAAGFMHLADGLEKVNDAAGAQFWRAWSLKVSS